MMEATRSNNPEIDGNDGSNNIPTLKKTNPVFELNNFQMKRLVNSLTCNYITFLYDDINQR